MDSMKKVTKISCISLCFLCPLTLVTAFATNWNKQTSISCVGSSGVKPFVELISQNYSNQPLDIAVEAGGSGFGIDELIRDHCNIGTTSTNPYQLLQNNKEALDIWKQKRIKTITIGWEAICLVYKLPNYLSLQAQKKFEVSITEENVNKLFAIFSGFKEKNEPIWNWLDFIPKECQESFSNDDKSILANSTIIPYVRSGGNTTSGTAMAFCHETHFSNFKFDSLPEKQKQAFEAGQYGNDIEIYQTDEANSRSWDMFCKNNIPGSMLYLSSGFVETNKKLIENYGYKIAKYNGIEYSIENARDHKYKWFRPINCSFPLANEKIKTFLQDTLDNWVTNNELFIKNGAFLANNKEIESMFKENQEWKSDAELNNTAPQQPIVYGAVADLEYDLKQNNY